MVLVVVIAVVIGAVLIYGWIRLINRIFNPLIKRVQHKRARIRKEDNPYIMSHRIKMHNDEMYQEYLEWLDKNGGDIPFEKWKTDEEREFDGKLS